MVPCQSCGEYIEDSGRFCAYCGTEQAALHDTAEAPTTRPPTSPSPVGDLDLGATLLVSPPPVIASRDDDINGDTFKDPVALGEAGRASVDMAASGRLGSVSGMGQYDVGEVVDHYRIESVLGSGGMGQVFRAVHEITGQEVALKMLHQEKNDAPKERERFLNEARVLAQLDHPNLVPLLGFIEQADGIFIVLPFIDGETLEERLSRDGRPDLDTAVAMFDQLCAGLAWVHDEKNILHRDLKPANVMITEEGVVKLTDFGIARQVGDKAMTAAGMVVGTAEYLAPERASGTLRDDPRSDLYGLAVMFYEMLTGQPPFRDPNAAKVMLKHLNHLPPPPRGINPSIPGILEVEVLKALAKDPDERHPSVAAFREAVQQAMELAAEDEKPTIPISTAGLDSPMPARKADPATPAKPTSGGGGRGWLIALVLTLVLGGGGFAAYYFLGGQ